MRRASRLAPAILLAVLTASAPALGQDGDPPAATIAPLASALGPRLQRAVRDGELAPLLGERVLLRADEGEVLVLRVSRAGEDRLRCEVALVILGGMRAERTRHVAEVDLSTGATRALGAEVLRGRDRQELDGPVEGGQATLRVRTHRRGGAVEEQPVGVAWPGDAVAWPVVLTLAPLLTDPALDGRLALRLAYPLSVLSGADLGGEAHVLARGGDGRALRLEPAAGGPAQVITLLADRSVTTVEVPGAGVYTLVDRAAAERLAPLLR